MATDTLTVSAACATQAELFQHRLLEDPPAASALSAEERRLTAQLMARADQVCAGCPLKAQCLYEAVVNHDIAGFAAGTTARQRVQMRRQLSVRVDAEDLDVLAGVFTPHRQVNHEEVLRLRRTNPDVSLETLASRLGCSLSTVKRHLRKERTDKGAPALAVVQPSRDEVLSAYRDITGKPAARRRIAVVA